MLTFIEKYWYYLLGLVRFGMDIPWAVSSLVSYIADIAYYSSISSSSRDIKTSEWFTPSSLNLAFWLTASVNSIILLTFDFLYTGTILGSFLVQQVIVIVLVALHIARILVDAHEWRIYLKTQVPEGYQMPDLTAINVVIRFLYPNIYISLTLLVSAVLWARFIRARRSGALNGVGSWMVNAEDLASNTGPLSRRATWGGVSRQKDSSPRRHVRIAARVLGVPVTFVRNSMSRRVISVETLRYAFFQNILALAAIILILTRVIILLAQVQNEDFQTRTRVGECSSQGQRWFNVSLLVGHPEDRGVNTTKLALDISEYSSQVQIALGDFKAPFRSSNSNTTCGTSLVHSRINNFNITDGFRLYNCTYETRQNLGFRYIISPKNMTVQAEASDFPRLWFQQTPIDRDLTQLNNTVVPYLIPPIEPSPGMHTLSELYFAERRFITSSGIMDAITGSKPAYGNIVVLYKWRYISSRPIYPSDNISTDGNNQNIAYGTVLWPKFITFASGLTEAQLDPGALMSLCEVIEDYRSSSAFDVLGSIGGLLALLQGIHMFLFGRPLFWGLFGAKLISPFGLVGKLATKGFRQRLRSEYYPSGIQNERGVQEAVQVQEAINMTQFLLDYVLDMGPASAQKPKPELPNTTQVSSDVELSRVSQDRDLHHRHSKSTVVPLLAGENASSRPGFLQDDQLANTTSSTDSVPLKM
ncbi:hypothetical protein BDV93DRAFT_607862, partial [Ceratobasidium sp. AG-I]